MVGALAASLTSLSAHVQPSGHLNRVSRALAKDQYCEYDWYKNCYST